MAEVRLRFWRGAYTFLKPSYLQFLDKDAGYVAALIHSPRHDPNKCLESPKGETSEMRARLFTFLRDAGGSTGRLKTSFDFFTGDISVNRWTELHEKCITADVNNQESSCLETHLTRPVLCGRTNSYGFKHQSRKSVYTQTLHGPSCAPLTLFSRAYSRKHNNDSAVPLYKSKSAYYDILEVSPRATQTQIKTAYYKQSFIYHPDKNAGSEEATFRFSQISEAYNVLGNKALRKKYDRGVLRQVDLHGSSGPTGESAASSSAGHQARARHSPKAGVGQEKIFDFDAFIRAHYGEQLQREKELRQRREEILRKQKEKYEDVKLGRMKEVTVGILLVMAMTIVLSLGSNN